MYQQLSVSLMFELMIKNETKDNFQISTKVVKEGKRNATYNPRRTAESEIEAEQDSWSSLTIQDRYR